jgi:DNA repair protein RecO (recombination protein O)
LNQFPTRGFVLAAFPLGEADKLAQLYTLSLGRVKAVVKGARKPKSKLASALDLFSESSFTLHKKNSGDLYILGQARVLNGHPELKKDLAGITALQVMADILLQALHDTEPQPELYALIGRILAALGAKEASPELVLSAFGVKLLDLSGYPLELSACAECGTPLSRKKARLIPHRGGALCGDCCLEGPSRLVVSPADLEVMKKLRTLPMEKVHILKLRPRAQRGIFLAILEYLERTLEKKLKSIGYYLTIFSGLS